MLVRHFNHLPVFKVSYQQVSIFRIIKEISLVTNLRSFKYLFQRAVVAAFNFLSKQVMTVLFYPYL